MYNVVLNNRNESILNVPSRNSYRTGCRGEFSGLDFTLHPQETSGSGMITHH